MMRSSSSKSLSKQLRSSSGHGSSRSITGKLRSSAGSSSNSLTGLNRRSSSNGSLTGLLGGGAGGDPAAKKSRRKQRSNRTLMSSATASATNPIMSQSLSMKSMRIRCDGQQDRSTILSAIEQSVKADTMVTNLVVQDLLSTPKHKDLIPSMDALVFATDREWTKVRFRDTFQLKDYPIWRKQKALMIVDYEGNDLNETYLRGVITWNGTITMPTGTNVEQIMDLFRDIKEDPHVIDMRVNGGLPSPSNLVSRIDWSYDPSEVVTKEQQEQLMKNYKLQQPVTIDVECGWIVTEDQRANTSYKMYINVCLCKIREAHRQNRKQIQKQNSRRQLMMRREDSYSNSSRRSASRRNTSRSPSRSPTRSPTRTRSGSSRDSLAGMQRMHSDDKIKQKRSKSTGSLKQMKSADYHDADYYYDGEDNRQLAFGGGEESRANFDWSLDSSSEHSSSSSPKTTRRKRPTKVTSIRSPRRSLSPNQLPKNVDHNDDDGDYYERTKRQLESLRSLNSVVPSSVVLHEESSSQPQKVEEDAQYWRSAIDPATGDTYYYHKKTKETLWEKPAAMKEYERRTQIVSAHAKAG